MTAQAHRSLVPTPAPRRPALRVIETRRRTARLHLLTFVVGNALFWTLWGAMSVTAGEWYWWPVVPIAGWAIVLAFHLRRVYRQPGS